MKKLMFLAASLLVVLISGSLARPAVTDAVSHPVAAQSQVVEASHSSFPPGICRKLTVTGWYLWGPYTITWSYFDRNGMVQTGSRVLPQSGLFGSNYSHIGFVYGGAYFRDFEFLGSGPHTANVVWGSCLT